MLISIIKTLQIPRRDCSNLTKNVTLVTHLSFNGSTGKLKLRADMQNYAKLVLLVYNPQQPQMNSVS
jgi:hypothetical protein